MEELSATGANIPMMAAKPFGFPFAPYDIQLQFMHCLSKLLQEGGIGVFESPTGTVCWAGYSDLIMFCLFSRASSINTMTCSQITLLIPLQYNITRAQAP